MRALAREGAAAANERRKWMTKPFLAAGILVMTLAAEPASAQQSQPAEGQPPASQTQTEKGKELIGLPVFSSDGQKLGKVTEVGVVPGGQQAIRAEIGEFLGTGTTPVVIVPGIFQKKTDRIEVAMTAAEVRDSVSKQREKRDKK